MKFVTGSLPRHLQWMFLAALVASSTFVNAAEPSRMSQRRSRGEDRMAWFRQAKFGMFIHWGIYWPSDGKLELKGVTGGKAWLLADRDRAGVKAEPAGGGVRIMLPGAAPDAADSVVVLERQ